MMKGKKTTPNVILQNYYSKLGHFNLVSFKEVQFLFCTMATLNALFSS